MTAGKTAIEVRKPQPEDLPGVVAMENRCFSDPWSPQALDQELTPDRLRLPLVAEISGRLAGYLMAWKIVDQLHILNIATDPDYRRRGVATSLLNTAVEQAARWKLIDITLEVRESNREARAFYTRHGFTARGLRKGYYADNGEDAIVMTRRVAGFPDS